VIRAAAPDQVRRGVGLLLRHQVGGLGGLVLVECDQRVGAGGVDGVLCRAELPVQLVDPLRHGVGGGLRGGDLAVTGAPRGGLGHRRREAESEGGDHGHATDPQRRPGAVEARADARSGAGNPHRRAPRSAVH
jgi:hypothetical protein